MLQNNEQRVKSKTRFQNVSLYVVIATATGNEIGKPSSNFRVVCCIHFCTNAPDEGMHPSILPTSQVMCHIAGPTGHSNLL